MIKSSNLDYAAIYVKKGKNGFYLSKEKNSINLNNISKKEVIIKVSHSTINYKDILICNGNPGLVRKYPHIPGIDFAGIVLKSHSKKFKKGDKVFVVAKPFGINNLGSFREIIKLEDKYLEKLPKGINLKNSMIFGTAGFTAALCVIKMMKEIDQNNKNKKILVTGATGGVGSMIILLLSKLGFNITALTSKKNQNNYLKKIGVKEIIYHRDYFKKAVLHLLSPKYKVIIDNIGGEALSIGTKELEPNGIYFSIGNVISNQINNFNLMPFILRGIKLIGVNAENSIKSDKKLIWNLLASLSKDKRLKHVYNTIKFNEIIKNISKIKRNKNIGKILIEV